MYVDRTQNSAQKPVSMTVSTKLSQLFCKPGFRKRVAIGLHNTYVLTFELHTFRHIKAWVAWHKTSFLILVLYYDDREILFSEKVYCCIYVLNGRLHGIRASLIEIEEILLHVYYE